MRSHISAEIVQRLEEGAQFVKPWLDVLYIAGSLGRIGHHATHIADDVVFMVDSVDFRHGHLVGLAGGRRRKAGTTAADKAAYTYTASDNTDHAF
jgi:hypothetical protein